VLADFAARPYGMTRQRIRKCARRVYDELPLLQRPGQGEERDNAQREIQRKLGEILRNGHAMIRISIADRGRPTVYERLRTEDEKLLIK